MVILHGSDFQVGKPFRRDAARAFLDLSRALAPDLIVIAGDLTQRAKEAEYQEVRAFLDDLAPTPVVVTPGNHDVPLYRFWERLAAPYRNWRRYVSPMLDTVTHVAGATVVALNSSAPRRAIVGGRVDAPQVAFARKAFAEAGPGGARVLVVHHHFVPTTDGLGGRPLPGADRLLGDFEAMGVDLILGGHVHQTHLRTSRDLIAGSGDGIPLVACGTTASSRGRGPEAGRNTLNVIHIGADGTDVVSHAFDAGQGGWIPSPARFFPRRARPRTAGVGGGGDA